MLRSTPGPTAVTKFFSVVPKPDEDLPYEHAGDVGRDEDGEEQQVAAEIPPLLHLLPGIEETQSVDCEGDGENAVEEPGDDGADDDGDDESEDDAGQAKA